MTSHRASNRNHVSGLANNSDAHPNYSTASGPGRVSEPIRRSKGWNSNQVATIAMTAAFVLMSSTKAQGTWHQSSFVIGGACVGAGADPLSLKRLNDAGLDIASVVGGILSAKVVVLAWIRFNASIPFAREIFY
jgi:hypothetical protein